MPEKYEFYMKILDLIEKPLFHYLCLKEKDGLNDDSKDCVCDSHRDCVHHPGPFCGTGVPVSCVGYVCEPDGVDKLGQEEEGQHPERGEGVAKHGEHSCPQPPGIVVTHKIKLIG